MAHTEGADYLLLLVDDNPTNLSLLCELIHQNLPQCRVLTASNGADALEIANTEPPDGVLLDMQMPGMDGIEVCRRLKADPRTAHAAVILMTAHQSTPELRADGLDAGAQDFICQPIRNVELLARIRALLRIRQLERDLRSSNSELQARMARKNATLRWVSGLLSAADSTGALTSAETVRQLETLLAEDGELDLSKFDGQLFARFPDALRRTLWRIGLIGQVPGALTLKLAEIDDVRGALDYLVRHNYFVDYSARDDCYQVNPPLKDYLVRMARQELSAGEQRQVFVVASDWFFERGDLVRGLDYLIQSGDGEGLERICSEILPQVYAEGRMRHLRPHVEALSKVLSDGSRPWGRMLLGLLLFETEPAEAVVWLRAALQEFRHAGDSAGTVFAASILLKHICLVSGDFSCGGQIYEELTGLYAEFDLSGNRHIRILGAFSLGLTEMLIFGNLQKADIYLTLALETAREMYLPEYLLTGRIGRALLSLYQGRWNAAMRELELATGYGKRYEVNISTRLMFHHVLALLLQNMGDVLGCRQQIALARKVDGLFLQQSLFQLQLTLLEVQNEIAHDHVEPAQDLLAAHMAAPGADSHPVRGQILALQALIFALSGQHEEAEQTFTEVAALGVKKDAVIYRCREEIFLAWARTALGDWQAAQLLAQNALQMAESLENPYLQASALAILGYACYRLDRSGEAAEFYQQAQVLMDQCGLRNLLGWNPRLMTDVFASMIRLGVAGENSRVLSRDRIYVSYLRDGSPIPTLRFRILGDYSVSIGGKTIHLQDGLTAALRQLLGLILISRGCHLEVGEVQSQFWPDSPPEQGRSRIDSLMSRLRRTLEGLLPDIDIRHYLYLRRGVIGLDNCWLDATEFETLVRAGLRHAKRREHLLADQHFRRAHRLWRGEVEIVLPNDHNQEYYRQELLLLYLESTIAWMDLLQESRQWDELIGLGQRALKYDATNEDVVRRLYRAGLLSQRPHLASQVLRDYGTHLSEDGYDRDEVRAILTSLEESCRQDIRTLSSPD